MGSTIQCHQLTAEGQVRRLAPVLRAGRRGHPLGGADLGAAGARLSVVGRTINRFARFAVGTCGCFTAQSPCMSPGLALRKSKRTHRTGLVLTERVTASSPGLKYSWEQSPTRNLPGLAAYRLRCARARASAPGGTPRERPSTCWSGAGRTQRPATAALSGEVWKSI